MTLDLTTEQPAEAATETPASTDSMPAILATLVTIDGVVVRLADRPDGSLAILPSGNRAPIVLDRFQRGAMMAALAEG